MYTKIAVAVLFAVAVAVNTVTAQSFNSISASNLTTPISRTGCGTNQLCVPANSTCDPSTSQCYFASAKVVNGSTYQFALSGNTTGYIALVVSTGSSTGNNDTTYICANNQNTSVLFYNAYLNNTNLIPGNQTATSVNGSINGTKIQCIFNAQVPAPTTKATSVILQIVVGVINPDGSFGAIILKVSENVPDLSNPSSNVPTTAAGTSPNHGVTLQQSITQAVLISMGLLGLAMM